MLRVGSSSVVPLRFRRINQIMPFSHVITGALSAGIAETRSATKLEELIERADLRSHARSDAYRP